MYTGNVLIGTLITLCAVTFPLLIRWWKVDSKNYMKQEIVRHGEVILKPIDKLPENLTLKESTNEAIIAHSETGHHHLLKTKVKEAVKIYTTIDGETFVEVGDIAQLLHKKTGKNVHKTHTVNPGAYNIILKKEFNYYEGVLKTVRD